MTFAEYIKEKRKKMGRTQKDLAKMLGVSPSTINLWESSKGMPRDDLHLKVAAFYKMSQEEINTLLNPHIKLDASEINVAMSKKERAVRIVHAATDFKNDKGINESVEQVILAMSRQGWTVLSAQTAFGMYFNERGFSVRTVQWCTTIVFER